jgi:N-acyl homoserine lactone hydrolase
MNTYTIRPIVTGYTHTHKGTYVYHHTTHKYYDAEGYVELPVTCFLVEGSGKKILIDTGMSSTEIAHKYHHPGSYQPQGYAIQDQLAKLGISPEEIDLVILTHLHWDHVYYMAKFVNARFFVQRIEYEFATDPIPLYFKSYEFPILGLDPQFKGIEFELLDGETVIIDGISVYPTPGHSIGHQAVIVNTEVGEYHCVGDALFIYDNLNEIPEIHYTISPPARYENITASWLSIEQIKKRAADISFILPTHEPLMDEKFKQGIVFGEDFSGQPK